ncbi:hypothetical protein ACA910_010897 [Epithemia clementina (nom. ined.)]
MATSSPSQSGTSPSLPSTMKTVIVQEFVSDFSNDENLEKAIQWSSDTPVPRLQKNEMLIKVQACSISAGDVIMVGGNLIFLHPNAFPFVPGMDVCGKVVDPNGSEKFKAGDVVVAANGMSPVGGMAEYMAIKQPEAVLKPESVPVLNAAASSSAITARNAVMDHVKEGDRVLILGGSGGVGSAAISFAKHVAKASFVATTSTQADLCTSLGADVVLDYRTENWWERQWGEGSDSTASAQDGIKATTVFFDKIIDCVGGGNFVGKAEKVCKPGSQGGEFVAVTGDDPKPDARTLWKAVQFFANLPWRPLYTRWIAWRSVPTYILLMPYDLPQGRAQVLELMEQGKLSIKLDPQSPHSFSAEGARKAFQILASGHAHGKVVVAVEP